MKIIVAWGLWGPYHCARFAALRSLGLATGHEVAGVSLFSGSSHNQWSAKILPAGVEHIPLGADETRFPLARINRLIAIPARLRADVALVPSYVAFSLALNAGARLAGCKVVMMNETHAGTARATGLAKWLKRRLVRGFDAALVGGRPHQRYFASLGLPVEKIFTGYDAVDNAYFAERAAEVRGEAAAWRARHALPARYFLNLGRFVAKKNLPTLLRAYHAFLTGRPADAQHLVLVGAGPEEPALRALCAELRLPVYEKAAAGQGSTRPAAPETAPGVHFYGFRQIEENPVFYALADAFILPSSVEEWGLVVNEAMACSLPVIVSQTAGCAEDLLPAALPPDRPLAAAAGIRRNGFVFNPASEAELAAALGELSAQPGLREAMGAASRRIVEAFSCEVFARNALAAARVAMGEDPILAAGPVPSARPPDSNRPTA